ncbi:MFS transporter [Acetobacteraceae bacterium H6797]|nr:MFS transporter [Acetobacteraceae bacterium H6797]
MLNALILGGFASGCGMRLLDPLLPMIAGDLKVEVASLSILIAAFALAYGTGQIITGPLGDKLGKIRVLTVALLLYGVLTMGGALVTGLPLLVALRAFCGLIGGAIIPLAMAWIGDTVPYAERQAVIGRLLTGMVGAQLLAGPIAGVLGEFFGWRAAFIACGGVALLAGLLLVKKQGPGLLRRESQGGSSGIGMAAWGRMLSRPAARRLMLAAAIDGFLLFGGAFPYLGSFLIQEFGLSAAGAGLVVAVFGLGSLTYTRLAKRLVSGFGELKMVLFGGATLALGLAALAIVPDWHLIILIQLVFGMAFFTFHGVLQARATEALPEARATSVAAFAMALFLGQSLGSVVFGQIMGFAGYRTAFAIAAVAMLALAIWTRASLRRPA